MEAIFILVPVSVGLVFIAIATFIWSVNHHQFDDLEKEAERILFDNQPQKQLNKQELDQAQDQEPDLK